MIIVNFPFTLKSPLNLLGTPGMAPFVVVYYRCLKWTFGPRQDIYAFLGYFNVNIYDMLFEVYLCLWEGLVVLKRTISLCGDVRFYSGAGASVDGPGSSSVLCRSAYCVLWYLMTSLVLSGLPAAGLW